MQIVLFPKNDRTEINLNESIEELQNQRIQPIKVNQQQVREREVVVPQQQNSNKLPSQKAKTYNQLGSTFRVRLAGIFLLTFLLIMLFPYGFYSTISTSHFTTATLSQHALVGLQLILCCVFTVIGFGLIFSYYGENILSGFFISVYVVSSTIIICPLLQKLWFNIFIGNFTNSAMTFDTTNIMIYSSLGKQSLPISYNVLKLSLTCAISQLVVYLGVIGKMQIYKIIFTSFIFNIMWNFNFFLCMLPLKFASDARLFDDYAIGMTYLFAGMVCLTISIDMKCLIKIKQSTKLLPIYPKIYSLIGLFFVFLSFTFTSNIMGSKQIGTTVTNTFRLVYYPEGSIGMLFALSASTISAFAFSVVFNGEFSISNMICGSISGAIMFGAVAGYSSNISIPISCGIVSGFISVLYTSVIMPRVNHRHLNDSIGIFGPILMVSLVGVLIVAPVVGFLYVYYGIISPAMNVAITNRSAAGWVLFYAGISIAIGWVGGSMISNILRCLERFDTRFGDRLIFVQHLSLREQPLEFWLFQVQEKEESKRNFVADL